MPLDAICLMAVKDELSGRITGMKIDKIRQPEREVLLLALRGSEGTANLLISAGSADARVHITNSRFENPESPPMFCMLLRKHLTGARITAITQPPSERVLTIMLETQDTFGELGEKRLVLELMGRFSNIVLIDAGGIVIDCLRRIGGGMDDRRRVLPGLIYQPPPAQAGKHDPLCVTEEEWQELFDKTAERTADKWLLGSFTALSPLICRELSWRAYGEIDFALSKAEDGGAALRREFFTLIKSVREGAFTPCMLTDVNNSPRDFSYTRILQYGSAFDITEESGFSVLLENYFTRTSQLARVVQKASNMTRTVKNARDRILRKLEAQRLELKKTYDRDFLRECGDLIMANLHAVEKGMKTFTAQDYYSQDGKTRDIALDPLKTPQQNAARYYRDYTKAKNAERFLTEQIKHGENELSYLESVLEELALAEGVGELEEIRRELYTTGYIKAHKTGKKEKGKISAPVRFVSSTGMEFRAGRNNIQNDALTLKSAFKTDYWLHAKNIHGAHVVITCAGGEPDETTLYEAAAVAAWYSKARDDGKVPVDYCLVKNVKKPPGGRPGAVIYTNFKTISVIPDETLVMRLKIV